LPQPLRWKMWKSMCLSVMGWAEVVFIWQVTTETHPMEQESANGKTNSWMAKMQHQAVGWKSVSEDFSLPR